MLKRTGYIAVAIFLVALAFPFFYNMASGGLFSASAGPKLKIEKEGKCVRDTGWMRKNHMKLLIHTREGAVRDGVRLVNESLHGCISCHPKREEFCSSCHEYNGVQPECWDCHNYPL